DFDERISVNSCGIPRSAPFKVHWLGECAVNRRVPGGEAYPFLASEVNRDAEGSIAEWRFVCRRDYLTPGRFTIPPNDLDKLQRKRPLYFRAHRLRSIEP